MDIDNKLKIANQECSGIWCYDIDNKFKYIYPYTTENIAAYMPYLDLANKTLATVGSSGDQALNAVLFDCNDITVIDICPFAKEYFYLKKAAITLLSRNEFLSFFAYKNGMFENNSMTFNKKTYQNLREIIKEDAPEVAYFWDYLFKKYNGLRIRKRLFIFGENPKSEETKLNAYLQDNLSYNEIKNKINNININFIQNDLHKIELNNKYDNIILSNLFTYCSSDQINLLFKKMYNLLNDNGIMQVAYLYQVDKNNLYNEEKLNRGLNNILDNLPQDIILNSFQSVYQIEDINSSIKDTVITYKKVKKI